MLRAVLGLNGGERLLVVSDGTLDPKLVNAACVAAEAVGVRPFALRYASDSYVSPWSFGNFASASLRGGEQAVDPLVLAAMESADAVVLLNSDLSMTFDGAFRSLAKERTRIGWLPLATVDSVLRLLPASADEVRELHDLTVRVAAVLRSAREVELITGEDSTLSMSLGEHPVYASTGHVDGEEGYAGMEILPGGQVIVVPDEGSASGVLCVDRSVNAPQFKAVSAPIRLRIANGRLQDVEGGCDAAELDRYLRSLSAETSDVYHVTELGIGTNARCSLSGISAPLEDTHRLGTVSMALGADSHLGGKTRAPCHVDMTTVSPTLVVDGRPLVVGGRLDV